MNYQVSLDRLTGQPLGGCVIAFSNIDPRQLMENAGDIGVVIEIVLTRELQCLIGRGLRLSRFDCPSRLNINSHNVRIAPSGSALLR